MTSVLTLVFFIVVLAVGVQIVFSPQKVSGWVEGALADLEVEGLSRDEFKISFEKARTTVLGSFTYPLGIRIKNLSIRIEKKCKIFVGKIDTVVLPFHFRKALDKEIELGLVRINGGSLNVSKTCSVKDKKNSVLQGATQNVLENKQSAETKLIHFIEKLADFDLSFVKDRSGHLRLRGLLIYDFSFKPSDEKEFLFDRFKALLGEGELLAGGEWSSRLILADGVTHLTGSFKVSDEAVKAQVNVREKEGRLSFKAIVSRNKKVTPNAELAHLEVKMEDFPLSIISRFKTLKVVGLNLRKTWLELDAEGKVFSDKVFISLDKFEAHGDFGGLEMGMGGLQVLWTKQTNDWKQTKDTDFKLADVSLEEIVAITPKKKAHGVFGEFGKFNASFKLKNLKSFYGDFETKDFSIIFRSMGKAAYQKAKYARGKIGYIVADRLFVILDDVELVDGDFEGFIRLDYDYGEKLLHTKFEIPHFKLSPKISEGLFKLKFKEDMSIFGEGRLLRSTFTNLGKSKNSDAEASPSKGNLQFIIKTKQVDFPHWGLSDVKTNCGLDEDELKCGLETSKIKFSDELAKKAMLSKKIYEELKSKDFSYRDDKLSFSLENSKTNLLFDWHKKSGLSFYPNGYGKRAVKIRELD